MVGRCSALTGRIMRLRARMRVDPGTCPCIHQVIRIAHVDETEEEPPWPSDLPTQCSRCGAVLQSIAIVNRYSTYLPGKLVQ